MPQPVYRVTGVRACGYRRRTEDRTELGAVVFSAREPALRRGSLQGRSRSTSCWSRAVESSVSVSTDVLAAKIAVTERVRDLFSELHGSRAPTRARSGTCGVTRGPSAMDADGAQCTEPVEARRVPRSSKLDASETSVVDLRPCAPGRTDHHWRSDCADRLRPESAASSTANRQGSSRIASFRCAEPDAPPFPRPVRAPEACRCAGLARRLNTNAISALRHRNIRHLSVWRGHPLAAETRRRGVIHAGSAHRLVPARSARDQGILNGRQRCSGGRG